MNRRYFLASSAILWASTRIKTGNANTYTKLEMINQSTIIKTKSDFEREKLRFPFGFKGAYLSELWQIVVLLENDKGKKGLGLATQSVLYGDAELFASTSESSGNAN